MPFFPPALEVLFEELLLEDVLFDEVLFEAPFAPPTAVELPVKC